MMDKVTFSKKQTLYFFKPLDVAQESYRVATFSTFQKTNSRWPPKMIHSSVNFYANPFKFETSRKKKSFFSKLKNGGLHQDGVSTVLFFWLSHSHFSTDFKI
jgi:hypothetical protein